MHSSGLMLWRAHGDLNHAATGLGLHRERDLHSPPTISSEMRRRVWAVRRCSKLCVPFSQDFHGASTVLRRRQTSPVSSAPTNIVRQLLSLCVELGRLHKGTSVALLRHNVLQEPLQGSYVHPGLRKLDHLVQIRRQLPN